jgi:hypothetical protein
MDANTLRARFHEEQAHLRKYVEYLRFKTAISRAEISEIASILSRHGITTLDAPRIWISDKPLTVEELEAYLSQIHSIEEKIKSAKDEINKELALFKFPEDGISVDVRSFEGELIQYMMDALEGDHSSERLEDVRQDALRQHQDFAAMNDEEPVDESVFDQAIQSALFILKSRKVYALEYVLEKSEEIDMAVRMLKPEAEFNVLRQGFILLMTIFDATMFDLMRLAINRDFFRLISVVAKQDKVSLENMNKYNTFDQFRDEIIEEQLKPKYLKDILFILDNQNVRYVDDTSGFRSIHVKEMLQRRNIHIHNRGRIDERYIERDNNGTSRYNIYNLPIGSIAQIDFQYWEMANRLCEDCIDYVASWVETLSMAKSGTT